MQCRRLAETGTELSGYPSGSSGDKTRIVDKAPGNFLYIGLIRLILPNARIVHTVRDPVDTCVSCFSNLFADLPFSYDLAELGRYYRGYQELMAHWRKVHPADAFLDVSYEEVVEDLEHQARRLIDYCGLPWDDRCLRFHETNRPISTPSNVQVRRPLYRSSLAASSDMKRTSSRYCSSLIMPPKAPDGRRAAVMPTACATPQQRGDRQCSTPAVMPRQGKSRVR